MFARRFLCSGSAAQQLEGLQRRQLELIARLRGERSASLGFDSIHGRHQWDGVATSDECREAAEAVQRAMRRAADTDGDVGKLFPPDVDEARHYLGADAFALFGALRERVTERVTERYGPSEPVGQLVSWISGHVDAPEIDDASGFSVDQHLDWLTRTYAPHVDKANQPNYEVSTLLYLSTVDVDFTGGLFAFNDADRDRLVEPVAGRLIAFDSGFENLHMVRPVSSGERVVYSMWFRAAR